MLATHLEEAGGASVYKKKLSSVNVVREAKRESFPSRVTYLEDEKTEGEKKRRTTRGRLNTHMHWIHTAAMPRMQTLVAVDDQYVSVCRQVIAM